ncbi:MAG TPA: hypothetical protein VG929_07835 [Actinomycetota bacterium]|nr:hypothetical protein [Actinomycetota bacterium]
MAATVVAVASAGYAAAASLGTLTSSSLGAGNADVVACDDDGLTSSYVVAETEEVTYVTHVTVSDIADPGCEGARLSLTLIDDTGSAVGGVSGHEIPFDAGAEDNSVTVAIDPQPAASVVTGIHIAIVGGQ